MADISWIKLSVNLFDDEKIKLIRKMPEGNAILLIWIHLLCLAGKTNDGGAVYIGQHMYYTSEMLATVCDQSVSTIRLALQTFEKFGMVSLKEDGLIVVENWEKHQNIDGMEKIREQNRIRKRRQREREKLKGLDSSHVTSRDSHATEEIRIDKNRLDKNRNNHSGDDEDGFSTNIKKELVDSWNNLDENIPKLEALNSGTKRYKMLQARINQYGEDKIFEAIGKIRESNFLKGYVTDFTITFDWFIRPNNFIKVLEGNYTDKAENKPRAYIDNKKTAGQRFKERLEKRNGEFY